MFPKNMAKDHGLIKDFLVYTCTSYQFVASPFQTLASLPALW